MTKTEAIKKTMYQGKKIEQCSRNENIKISNKFYPLRSFPFGSS
jgi:hypothetical protein